MAQATVNRDNFLDCLKGGAILLVVLGHTFQEASQDFDNSWPFRVIYSFHMPMFMFVSGMVASIWFARFLGKELPRPQSAARWVWREIWTKAIRLLVPFMAWACVSIVVSTHSVVGLWGGLSKVIMQPDCGLWFLPALFICITLLTVMALLILLARRIAFIEARWAYPYVRRLIICAAAIMTYAVFGRLHLASASPLGSAYFPYFFVGVLFYGEMRPKSYLLLSLVSLVVFVSLVPFWYRVQPITTLPGANEVFRHVVAFAGTLAFLGAVRAVMRAPSRLPQQVLAYLGVRSLDVYAAHFYFLAYWPPVIAPLVGSLLTSLLVRSNRLTRTILLGEWRRREAQATQQPVPRVAMS